MILYITIIHVCVCVVEILKGKMIFKGFQEAEKGGGGTREAGSDD